MRFFHRFFHFFSKTFCREINKTVHFSLEEKKKRFLYKCQSKSPISKKWKIAIKCKKCIFCKNQNGTSTNNLMMNMLQKTACLSGVSFSLTFFFNNPLWPKVFMNSLPCSIENMLEKGQNKNIIWPVVFMHSLPWCIVNMLEKGQIRML